MCVCVCVCSLLPTPCCLFPTPCKYCSQLVVHGALVIKLVPPPPPGLGPITFGAPQRPKMQSQAVPRAPVLPAPHGIPKVCSACHEGGLWARECPVIGHGGMGDKPFHNNTNVPPDPCWACLIACHWVLSCEKNQWQRAARVCILCGGRGHSCKKFDLYNPAIHNFRERRPTARLAGPCRPPIHPTSRKQYAKKKRILVLNWNSESISKVTLLAMLMLKKI